MAEKLEKLTSIEWLKIALVAGTLIAFSSYLAYLFNNDYRNVSAVAEKIIPDYSR